MAGYNYTALGYCSEVDIENFLLTDINDSFSPQIEDWIAGAEAEINKYLGYTTASGILLEQITNESVYGRVDSEGSLVVYPKKEPIVSVSAIALTRGTSVATLTLTDSNNNAKYDISPNSECIIYPGDEISLSGASLLRSFYELKGQRFYVRLSYIAGYTQVPADIRIATVNLVSDKIMRHSNKDGLEAISQGRVSKRWRERQEGESDFVKDAYKLLRPYRMATRWF